MVKCWGGLRREQVTPLMEEIRRPVVQREGRGSCLLMFLARFLGGGLGGDSLGKALGTELPEQGHALGWLQGRSCRVGGAALGAAARLQVHHGVAPSTGRAVSSTGPNGAAAWFFLVL